MTNDLAEALAKIRIPGESSQILWAILRKTEGWNKPSDHLSYSTFVELTGIKSYGSIHRGLARLLELNIIKKVAAATYSFNKDHNTWESTADLQHTAKKQHCNNAVETTANMSNSYCEKAVKPTAKKQYTIDSKDTKDKDNTKDSLAEIQLNFNSICKSLPKIKSIEDARLSRVKILLKKYPDQKWWTDFFTRVESSRFLSGDNDKNWSAGFDWILKPTNLTKIIEGNYDNKGERNAGKSKTTPAGGVRGESGKYDKITQRAGGSGND